MKCYNLSAAAVSLLLGFQRTSAFSLTSSSGPVLFTASPSGTKQSTSRMWGILDDMLMDDASNGSADDAASAASLSADKGDAAYASLFEELVFSTREMRLDVEERIDACGEEGFLAWLEATKESSPDPEEQAAIDEVLQTIKETQQKVQAQREEEAAQEAARLEAQKALEDATAVQAEEAYSPPPATMSTAELLKRASEIDQGVMVAEASDEEKPADFMRDAKATVGLGGFNNRGQMRVGGN